MTIKVSKPEINIREKLNDLDFDKVPFQKMPAGSVLQVVSVDKTDSWSTTSSTMVVVTGLTAAITPRSSNSKILVTVNLSIAANPWAWHAGLWQDDIEVGLADAASNRSVHFLSGMNDSTVQNTHGKVALLSRAILLTPNTVESVTYSVKAQRRPDNEGGSATTYVNRSVPDRNNTTYDVRNISSITLMEIAQ